MSDNFVQYANQGPGLQPIGATVKRLDAGYYDIMSIGGGTLIFSKKTLSTDSLLRLVDTKSDQVIAEIEQFWKLKERFTKFGMIHKRGFLLYGPPGSGKTSTIAIIIKKMIEADGIVINGSGCHVVHLQWMLKALRQVEPERQLTVILEDLEGMVSSSLLSMLDGDSIDNVVFVATTNYPERLEARIVNRPSRFDQVILIGMPSREARRQYLMHCDSETTPAELESWLDITDGFSVAQLKELVIGVRCFGHTANQVVERLRSMGLAISPDAKKEEEEDNYDAESDGPETIEIEVATGL